MNSRSQSFSGPVCLQKKSMDSRRSKILMVADFPDWAYDHMAQFVISELGEKYDFYIDYLLFHWKEKPHKLRTRVRAWRNKKRNRARYFRRRRILHSGEGYDLVFFMAWCYLWIGDFGIPAKGIIQGIYTDGFPPQGPVPGLEKEITIEEFVDKYLGMATSVVVGSRAIYDRYEPYVKNLYYATGAYDTDLFAPVDRAEKDGVQFVVGWTGNPKRSFKGFYDFVVPAVEQAASLRPGISLKTRFSGPLSTLPRFYDDVDVVVLASVGDAGPSCFTEAGACGVPAISPRTGSPAEVIRHGENGLFVDRSVDSIARAIVYLYDHRDLVRYMAKNIRRDIVEQWGYKVRAKMWDRVFEESLQRISAKVT